LFNWDKVSKVINGYFLGDCHWKDKAQQYAD
jgi:hypothetical protein